MRLTRALLLFGPRFERIEGLGRFGVSPFERPCANGQSQPHHREPQPARVGETCALELMKDGGGLERVEVNHFGHRSKSRPLVFGRELEEGPKNAPLHLSDHAHSMP